MKSVPRTSICRPGLGPSKPNWIISEFAVLTAQFRLTEQWPDFRIIIIRTFLSQPSQSLQNDKSTPTEWEDLI